MIHQDRTWFMYRPILDCCYRCRKPYYECVSETHPWFCYREAFACSTKCIVKAYWSGRNTPKSTDQILENYPLKSLFWKESSTVSSSGDHKSLATRRLKLPCFGEVCYGQLCFHTQLCFKVDKRYLKNIPVIF